MTNRVNAESGADPVVLGAVSSGWGRIRSYLAVVLEPGT